MNESNFNPQPEPGYDPQTGEQIAGHVSRERAADGQIISTVAHTSGGFIDLLEDGGFSADAYEQMRELADTMTGIYNTTNNKVKGKITLEIDLEKDGDGFRIQGGIKVKAPDLPRPKSIMWTDSSGNFTRFPPNQTQMFGTPRAVRRV